MTPAYRLVTSQQDLETVAEILDTEKSVAVDLEADSMYHFQEKVCLLQVASDRVHAVIDPIGVQDFACLKGFFANGHIRKIFHGADYDVRSLYRDFRIVINNLFDTQLACMFLGIRETGLNAVLNARFGITLDKKYQRKDWSRRPLPDAMIEYAARDTLYLASLADQLEKELVQKGRLGWVLEECDLLSKVRPAEADSSPLFIKFKGAGKLSRRALAVLEALLTLRNQLAEKKDRPPFKIISNHSLMTLANGTPTTTKQLTRSRALSPKQVQMYGQSVLAAVDSALAIPANRLPKYPRRRAAAVPPAVPLRLRSLKAWRDEAAADLEIDPGVLINNALLGAIAVNNPGTAEDLAAVDGIKNWQRDTFGEDILTVLERGRSKR